MNKRFTPILIIVPIAVIILITYFIFFHHRTAFSILIASTMFGQLILLIMLDRIFVLCSLRKLLLWIIESILIIVNILLWI